MTRSRQTSRRRLDRRAFTLIEMVTSLGIITILLVATGSAILLAGRAVPDRDSAVNRIVKSTAVLDQIKGELTYAKAVSELAPRAVTFTVPDRTGDGVDEVIRYAWDGTPGSPLTRRFNGSAASAVADGVREFELIYDRQRELLPTGYTLGPETLLFEHSGGLASADFAVTSSDWVAQTVRTTFASDVKWWRVTRVQLRLRDRPSGGGSLLGIIGIGDEDDGDDGVARVQVRDSDFAGNPGTLVFDHAVIRESNLDDSYRWEECGFTRNARIPSDTDVSVVVLWTRGTSPCDVQLSTLYLPGGALRTNSAGAVWMPGLSESLQLRVYGVTATERPPQYRYTLSDVRMSLRAGADPAGRVASTAVPSNRPEVAAP